MFGLSWDPGCPNPSPAILCDFYPPRPPYSSSNACFCSAQCAVQQQPVGFQHSGVLITGSHVSCSHLFPLTSSPFSFFPHWYALFPSPSIWTAFQESAQSTSKPEAERVNLLLLYTALPPLPASVDSSCTAAIFPECSIGQAALPSTYIEPCAVGLCSADRADLLHSRRLSFPCTHTHTHITPKIMQGCTCELPVSKLQHTLW